MIFGRVLNVKRAETELQSLGLRTNAAFVSLLDGAGFKVSFMAKHLINTQTPGAKVTRYNPKRERMASYPGDPPNTDQGTLAQSVTHEVDQNAITVTVGTNLKYGKALEFGTRKMAARPWLWPAFEMSRKVIFDTMARELKKAIRKRLKGGGG